MLNTCCNIPSMPDTFSTLFFSALETISVPEKGFNQFCHSSHQGQLKKQRKHIRCECESLTGSKC